MVFRCKMCGAPLEVDGTQSVVVCEYCECSQTVQLPPEPKKKEESSNYFKEAREAKERKEREEAEKRNLEKEREEQEKKKREREQEEYETRKREEEQEEYEKKKRKEEFEQEKHEEDGNHEPGETGGGCALWFKAIIRGFVLLTIGAFLLGVVTRNTAYKQAMDHKKEGEYKEALELFLEAGDHKDAAEQAEQMLDILFAEQAEKRGPMMESGKYDYLKDSEIGDIVTLGVCEQGKDNSTQDEPIEWKVIGKEEDRILVISKDILNSILLEERVEEWEDNPARSWLVSEFYEKVFSEEEKYLICTVINETSDYYGGGSDKTVDTVFLLSDEEVEKYMQNKQERLAEKTNYISGKSMSDGWLLRNPVDYYENGRSHSVGSTFFTIQVLSNGEIDYYVKNETKKTIALRPAMWLAME